MLRAHSFELDRPSCGQGVGLEGCLVQEKGCNYFVLVVCPKGVRTKFLFFFLIVGSVKGMN